MMQRIRSGSNNCREGSPSFRSMRSNNLGEMGGVGGGGSSDQLAVSIMRSSTNANAQTMRRSYYEPGGDFRSSLHDDQSSNRNLISF